MTGRSAYRFANGVVVSPWSLPPLLPYDVSTAERRSLYSIEVEESGDPAQFPFATEGPPHVVWQAPDGRTTISRGCAGFALEYMARARFVVHADANGSSVLAEFHDAWETCQHLLLDQVLPRVLFQMGETVLHSAAVEIDGRAALFLGATGYGKSTLTRAFADAGCRILSDDAIVLTLADGLCTAQGTYPSLRLVTQDPTRAAFGTKERIDLDPSHCVVGKVPLAAVFRLEPPDPVQMHVTVTPLTERETCMALLATAFMLDPTDHARTARLMQTCAPIASMTPGFSLAYPRVRDALPHVRDAVRAALAQPGLPPPTE
ncbi:MAG: hypothetical protein AB7O57_22465 [Hyphomicrobiaceae bacterium]